ncbi:unnamed protein product, partial [Laminaria digitata]
SVRAGSNSADADVSKNRVSRLRFATLSADMRSFVRENPGAVFADFVRWYSPRNWLGGSAPQRHAEVGLDDAGLADADGGVAVGGVTVEVFSSASDVEDVMRALVADIVKRATERATDHEVRVLPCADAATAAATATSTTTCAAVTGTGATAAVAAATVAAAVSTPASVSPTTAAACPSGNTATADEGVTRSDGGRTLLRPRGETGTSEGLATPPVDGDGSRPPDFYDRSPSTGGACAGGGGGGEGTEKRSGLSMAPASLLSSSSPSSIPSFSPSRPCPRRLDWGGRGKVKWRLTG